jgi:hypothetical protein
VIGSSLNVHLLVYCNSFTFKLLKVRYVIENVDLNLYRKKSLNLELKSFETLIKVGVNRISIFLLKRSLLKYFRYLFLLWQLFCWKWIFKKWNIIISFRTFQHCIDNCWRKLDNTLKMSDKDHNFTDVNMFSTLEVSLRYNFDILFFLYFSKLYIALWEDNKQTNKKQKITVTFNTNLPSNSKH